MFWHVIDNDENEMFHAQSMMFGFEIQYLIHILMLLIYI